MGIAMNKFLLLISAAVLSTTAGSHAATQHQSGKSGRAHISFGPTYCTTVVINWSGWFYGEFMSSLACEGYYPPLFGLSVKGKIKGLGEVVMGPMISGGVEGLPSYNSTFALSAPIKDGGTYTFIEMGGSLSAYEAGSGTYHVLKDRVPKRKDPRAISIREKMREYAKAYAG
jgi:hypothetical protein